MAKKEVLLELTNCRDRINPQEAITKVVGDKDEIYTIVP